MRADSDVTQPVWYRSVEEAPPLGQGPKRPPGSLPTRFVSRRVVPPLNQTGVRVSLADAIALALEPRHPYGIPPKVGDWFAAMDRRLTTLARVRGRPPLSRLEMA